MRNVHVVNMHADKREVRVFFHQAFVIGDSQSNTDTAQYLPDVDAILHYRGRRAFVISAMTDKGEVFDQYTTGLFDIEGHEGTYRDADDGELSMCPVEHGRVDSVLRFKLTLDAHSSSRLQYWIACGTSPREALYIHRHVQSQGIHKRMKKTISWWYSWLTPARRASRRIKPDHQKTFLRSAMIIKSMIDKRGAVMASTDSSMLNYSRDAYAYCWPRDAAYALWPLIRMGYVDEPRRYFEFIRRTLTSGGYLMHKYRADGALGSSWHPYVHDHGVTSPPIQEDETAVSLFVFAQFYHVQRDDKLLRDFYEELVVPMADFLASFVDQHTGLPKPSYDLWEQQFMVTTYTVAVTQAALYAAADLADVKEDADSAVRWRSAAEDIRASAQKQLYNDSRKALFKGYRTNGQGDCEYDETIDLSSIYGAFMYGLFPTDGHEMVSAVRTVEDTFGLADSLGKTPRFEHDDYHLADQSRLGNWWYIASLWMAQYYLEAKDEDKAWAVIDWVRDSAWASGVMSEQIDPATGKDASIAPLAWSQAEYIATLLDAAEATRGA